jgi:FHA domain
MKGAEADCPCCAAPHDPRDRYCTGCGYDFRTGAALDRPGPAGTPAPAGGLALVISVDAERLRDPDCPARPADLAPRGVDLAGPALVVGRSGPGVDVAIPGDPYVSRRHALISRVDERWTISDLGSTNGTRLNGVALEASEARPLGLDDVVELGFFTRLTLHQVTDP